MCMQDIFMFHLHMTLQSSSHPHIPPTTDLEFLFPRLFHCQSSLHSSIFSSGREIILYARARSWYEFIHPFSRHLSTSSLSAMLDLGGVISGDACPPTHSCLKLCQSELHSFPINLRSLNVQISLRKIILLSCCLPLNPSYTVKSPRRLFFKTADVWVQPQAS